MVTGEAGARERRASAELDWRGRMTGSEKMAMAIWVRSKAAAARLSRLDERCDLVESEPVDGVLVCAGRCKELPAGRWSLGGRSETEMEEREIEERWWCWW